MELKKKGNIIASLIWALGRLMEYKKTYLFFFFLQSVINGAFPIITLILIQHIIDMLQYKSVELKSIITVLIIVTFFQAISELILNYLRLRLDKMELEFDAHFQTRILKKIATLDCKDFEKAQTYDLINRTQYDANIGVLGTVKTLFLVVSLIITTFSYSVIIFKFNLWVLLIVLVLPVVRYFFEKKYNLEEYNISKKNTELDRRTTYLSFLITNAENFKEIKSYNLFDFLIRKFTGIKRIYNKNLMGLYNKKMKVYSVIGILESVIDFGVMVFVVIQTFGGIISIGNFVLYNNSIDNLKSNISSLFSHISYIYKQSAMIEQMKNFFEIQPEDVHVKSVEIKEITSIELQNLSYRYQGAQEYTLKDINLFFEGGQFTVMIGYNGSGKSTLMKIIMGIYNDYEGEIFINNINLKEINLKQYREKVSVLFQSYIKYEGSILDNILLGKLEKIEESGIKEVLKKIQLSEFEEHLEQTLGYQFTEGIQISIGQWQKLALGRALMKQAQVYIFDEPNASLDVLSEQSILDMIYHEMQNKITILIMHRFNCLLDRADKIIVLEKGEVQEVGNHVELLAAHGLYHQLYLAYKEMELTNSFE